MAPTAAMALNGTAPAGLIGRAVPLAFIFATIGVAFVSYAFIRLSRYYSHAGSVFAFSGVTLGPRAGFFSGWALLGTYFAFTCASTAEAGTFGVAFFSSTGIANHADYVVIALVAAVVITILAFGDIRVATRSLLGFEGISVLLILVLMVVIVVKLIGGSAPSGHGITGKVFEIPAGTSLSAIGGAAVFGFLSFAGFEGAASLGEETDNPRREIPRAIRTAVIGTGIWHRHLIHPLHPDPDLGLWHERRRRQGVLHLDVAARPAGAKLRRHGDERLHQRRRHPERVRERTRRRDRRRADPLRARARHAGRRLPRPHHVADRRAGRRARGHPLVGVGAIVAQRIAGVSAVDAFFYPGTFPILGIAFLGYTIYKNVTGQVFPYSRFWIVVSVWLVLGLGIVLFTPRLASRIGASLARDEGLEPPGEPPSKPPSETTSD